MENQVVLKGIVEIIGEVTFLEKHFGKNNIQLIIACLVRAQNLLQNFQVTDENKERVSKALLKQAKAEKLARDFEMQYSESFNATEFEVVLAPYKEGLWDLVGQRFKEV